MKKLDLYLNYIQESGISKEVRAGNLSKDSIDKLKNMGLIKSKEKYDEGIERGVKRSLRWKRIKFDQINHKMPGLSKDELEALMALSDEEFESYMKIPKSDTKLPGFIGNLTDKKGKMDIGPFSDPDKNILSIPKKVSKKFADYAFGSQKNYQNMKPLIKRHEADEMLLAKKLKKKYKIKTKLAQTQLPNLNVAGGAHFGPEVLKKEKKLIDFYHRAYGTLNHMINVRQPEYEEIKKYGTARAIRKARERAIRQGIRDIINSVQNITPNHLTFKDQNEYLKIIKPEIKKHLKLLPKTKINLKFIAKILKIIK